MTKELLQMALDALRHSIPSRRPGEDAYCERGWSEHKAAITALRSALAAPMPEPSDMVMVPREPTQAMCAAAVVFANGNAVYKNVLSEVLKLEESIYAEVYEAMIAAAPAPATSADYAMGYAEGFNDACKPAPVVREPLTDEQITKALRRAFSLGQTYWQQADSDSYKQNAKSDETRQKFETLIAETLNGITGGGK